MELNENVMEVLFGDKLTLRDIIVSVTEKNIKYQQKKYQQEILSQWAEL